MASEWDNLFSHRGSSTSQGRTGKKNQGKKKKPSTTKQQFPRDFAYSSNKDSPCLLTLRDALGTCFPSLSPFPGTISFGSFSDSGMSPLGAECSLHFQQFSISGENGPPCKSEAGCHCSVQTRETVTLESRKAQLFLRYLLGWVGLVLILSFGQRLPSLLKVTNFKIPGTKHVDMYSEAHSQPAN